ncbi:MAG: hypothetical protein AAF573_19195, partial [Bacteroidota bacterium]
FIPHSVGETIGITNQNLIRFKLSETRIAINQNSLPFLSYGAYLSIGKNVNKKIRGEFRMNYTYSNNSPVKGTYSLFGKDETLTGSFEKKFRYFGIEFVIKKSLKLR